MGERLILAVSHAFVEKSEVLFSSRYPHIKTWKNKGLDCIFTRGKDDWLMHVKADDDCDVAAENSASIWDSPRPL